MQVDKNNKTIEKIDSDANNSSKNGIAQNPDEMSKDISQKPRKRVQGGYLKSILNNSDRL